jgi:hypothetical protein
MDEEMTTISVSKKTLERIEKMKEHPRVPNEEILLRLVDFWVMHKDILDQKK